MMDLILRWMFPVLAGVICIVGVVLGMQMLLVAGVWIMLGYGFGRALGYGVSVPKMTREESIAAWIQRPVEIPEVVDWEKFEKVAERAFLIDPYKQVSSETLMEQTATAGVCSKPDCKELTHGYRSECALHYEPFLDQTQTETFDVDQIGGNVFSRPRVSSNTDAVTGDFISLPPWRDGVTPITAESMNIRDHAIEQLQEAIKKELSQKKYKDGHYKREQIRAMMKRHEELKKQLKGR